MQMQTVLALFLIVCCGSISAQETDCQRLFRSCTTCSSAVAPRDDVNSPNNCPLATRNTWIWREVSPCELQRLYCQSK
ncbi:hypothetical protein KR222_010786 [Zaprionus bogoriensis]|nr:hypothetical protein KR222_010786 [Zaprionus bogoriensis]